MYDSGYILSVSLTSSSKYFHSFPSWKHHSFTHVYLYSCSSFSQDYLRKLLDILCDPAQMSYPVADPILLCDLTVRHRHVYEHPCWQTLWPSGPGETSFPDCLPFPKPTELLWFACVLPPYDGVFSYFFLKNSSPLLSPGHQPSKLPRASQTSV